MIRKSLIALVAAAGLALSAVAAAQDAYTTRTVNVRAGPEPDYPLVATLPPGTLVRVLGCIADYSWCDVWFGDTRGWVFARGLEYVYQGTPLPIYSYGPSIGLPIISFSFGSYWDDHYRFRPWYRDRPRWERRWESNRDRWERQHRPHYVEPRPRYDGQHDYRGDRPRYEYRGDRPRYEGPRAQAQPPQVVVPQRPGIPEVQRPQLPQPQRPHAIRPEASRPMPGDRGYIDRTPPSREPGGN